MWGSLAKLTENISGVSVEQLQNRANELLDKLDQQMGIEPGAPEENDVKQELKEQPLEQQHHQPNQQGRSNDEMHMQMLMQVAQLEFDKSTLSDKNKHLEKSVMKYCEDEEKQKKAAQKSQEKLTRLVVVHSKERSNHKTVPSRHFITIRPT